MSGVIVFVTYPLKSRDLFYFFYCVRMLTRSLSGILDQIMPDSDLAIFCAKFDKSSASSTAYMYFSKKPTLMGDSLDNKIAEVLFMISLDCGHIKNINPANK